VNYEQVKKWERGECICPDPASRQILRMCPIHGVVAEEARGRAKTLLDATVETPERERN
jgi:hypothetical protein